MRVIRFILITFISFTSGLNVAQAGYVEKASYLYPIMIDIRHKDYDSAMAKLEPYVLENDPNALFWYGYMKQSKFGRGRFGAYRWFEKSGSLGNPYGVFKLSGADSTDYVCEVNGWECSDENLDKAIELWKELAAEGDVRAKYLASVYDRSIPGLWYEVITGKDLDRIREACEGGYCKPIRDLFWSAMNNDENSKEDWGKDKFQLIIDFVDKDPAIATYRAEFAYEGLTDEERIDLLIDSLKKGYYLAGNYLYSFAEHNDSISYEDAYVYAEVASMGGWGHGVTTYLVNKKLVSEEKIPELKLRAQEFYDNIDHVINFDEMDFMYMSRPDV
ncbi:hypothetical protein ACMXYV_07875 [Neptuniibacter sp. SY11_33]|uniref:hypothetical protein n=1 Tax=Neptuniibacter sp. SY11_33 TaxID=3398215 RepID=UPI0039F5D7E0